MSLQQRLKRKNPLSITSLNMLSKQGGAIGNRGMRTPMLLPSYVSKSPGLPSVPKPTPVKDSILAPVAKESVTPSIRSGLGGNYDFYGDFPGPDAGARSGLSLARNNNGFFS